jgi:general secretion pathway protein C
MRLRLPLPKIATVALFAALCAIVAWWGLQLLAPRPPVAPGGAVAQAQPPVDLRAAGELFGGAPTAGPQVDAGPSNVQVAGVLVAGADGVALLAVDGRPAKPFAVGESVSEGLRVRAVTADSVELERGGRPMRLPAPRRPRTEVLVSGPASPAAGSPQASPPERPPLPPAGAAAAVPPARPPLPPAGAAAAAPPTPPGPLGAGAPPGAPAAADAPAAAPGASAAVPGGPPGTAPAGGAPGTTLTR